MGQNLSVHNEKSRRRFVDLGFKLLKFTLSAWRTWAEVCNNDLRRFRARAFAGNCFRIHRCAAEKRCGWCKNFILRTIATSCVLKVRLYWFFWVKFRVQHWITVTFQFPPLPKLIECFNLILPASLVTNLRNLQFGELFLWNKVLLPYPGSLGLRKWMAKKGGKASQLHWFNWFRVHKKKRSRTSISRLSLASISESSVTKIGESEPRFRTSTRRRECNLRPSCISTLKHRLAAYSIWTTKSIVILCGKPKTHYPNAIIATIPITLTDIAVCASWTIYCSGFQCKTAVSRWLGRTRRIAFPFPT